MLKISCAKKEIWNESNWGVKIEEKKKWIVDLASCDTQQLKEGLILNISRIYRDT